ncbi:GNAT family N-acetyltransferase [Xenorhabdus sp. 12]|uniref:GNAT family N-acetyltransferase n=1 Tax=Xenorhabdus santafensis TaxID=2582833 RepID=A0ABU4S7S7_9GAMM|nr:GNAT family N-acetyltransferase [Xenorhabdus sp. 12]MDX7986840.1 GNAT family N-acetyltransferase [Xenorhabdus sp. 12]
MGISAPEILTAEHNVKDFYCQHETLNEWLSRRALKNNKLGASRTFVICKEGTKDVIGYYCLSAGSINHIESTPSLKRNMPDPIPVVLLGRLAIDVEYQGKKLGALLLQNAWKRVASTAEQVGISAIIVHAFDESARTFYMRLGFVQSPLEPYTLMLSLGKQN